MGSRWWNTPAPNPEIDAWREQVLRWLLPIALLVAGPAVISIARAGVLAYTVASSLTFGAVLFAALLGRRLSYRHRAQVVLGAVQVASTIGMLAQGWPSGRPGLLAVAGLATVLLGLRWGLAAVIVSTTAILTTPLLWRAGWFARPLPTPNDGHFAAPAAFPFVYLGASLVVTTAFLLERLSTSLAETRAAHDDLARRDALLQTIARGTTDLVCRPWQEAAPDVFAELQRETGVQRVVLCAIEADAHGEPGRVARPIVEARAADAPPPVFPLGADIDIEGEGFSDVVRALRRERTPQRVVAGQSAVLDTWLTKLGIPATDFLPVFVDQRLWGVIAFVGTDRPRPELDTLLALGGALGGAISRQEAEAELHRLAVDLEARVGERTKELEAFAYTVAHDLRSPLRHIHGFVGLLREQLGPALARDAEALRYAASIEAASVRMSRLIDALLELSRVGRAELRRQTVALRPLVLEARAQLPVSSVTFAVDESSDDRVLGDAVLLGQVVVNLLDNAVKFSRTSPEPRVEVTFTRAGSDVVLAVRDNGVGFDMAHADKLFGPFQRLHAPSEFEGDGIGLALVHRIVTRHGGRLSFEAHAGRGACFSVTLPAFVDEHPLLQEAV